MAALVATVNVTHEPCRACDGEGTLDIIRWDADSYRDQTNMADLFGRACGTCAGSGVTERIRCAHCGRPHANFDMFYRRTKETVCECTADDVAVIARRSVGAPL